MKTTKTNARPWRSDKKWVETFAELAATHTKAALDRAIAPLTARVGQLETDLAAAQAQIGKRMVEPR